MEADDREFMRELLLRHQTATDLMFRRFDAGTEEIRVRTDAFRAKMDADVDALARRIDGGTEALREHTREFVAESRAQREALFRILDRPDGAGA